MVEQNLLNKNNISYINLLKMFSKRNHQAFFREGDPIQKLSLRSLAFQAYAEVFRIFLVNKSNIVTMVQKTQGKKVSWCYS